MGSSKYGRNMQTWDEAYIESKLRPRKFNMLVKIR
jgi:hypothetical protein